MALLDILTGARPTTPPHQHHQHAPSRFLYPLLMAGVLFTAAMLTSRTCFGGQANTSVPESDSSPLAVQQKQSTGYVQYRTQDCANPLTGFVMEGVDLVEYFSLQAGEPAVAGRAEHVAMHAGYRFNFASAENMAMFQDQPSRYIPKWGGFCAWGISEEETWTRDNLGPPTNPDSWLVTADDELFLFRSDYNKDLFIEDIPGYTKAGNLRWEAWFGNETTFSSKQPSPLDTDCFCIDVDDDAVSFTKENCICGGESC